MTQAPKERDPGQLMDLDPAKVRKKWRTCQHSVYKWSCSFCTPGSLYSWDLESLQPGGSPTRSWTFPLHWRAHTTSTNGSCPADFGAGWNESSMVPKGRTPNLHLRATAGHAKAQMKCQRFTNQQQVSHWESEKNHLSRTLIQNSIVAHCCPTLSCSTGICWSIWVRLSDQDAIDVTSTLIFTGCVQSRAAGCIFFDGSRLQSCKSQKLT